MQQTATLLQYLDHHHHPLPEQLLLVLRCSYQLQQGMHGVILAALDGACAFRLCILFIIQHLSCTRTLHHPRTNTINTSSHSCSPTISHRSVVCNVCIAVYSSTPVQDQSYDSAACFPPAPARLDRKPRKQEDARS